MKPSTFLWLTLDEAIQTTKERFPVQVSDMKTNNEDENSTTTFPIGMQVLLRWQSTAAERVDDQSSHPGDSRSNLNGGQDDRIVPVERSTILTVLMAPLFRNKTQRRQSLIDVIDQVLEIVEGDSSSYSDEE